MAIPFPDILEHNNPNNPLIDVNQLEGVSIIDLLTERDIIPIAKRKGGHFVISKAEEKAYIYTGTTLNDIDWDNASNWTESGGAGLTQLPATQVTVTPPIGYTQIDQQSLDNDLAANTIKGATATHATIVDADTIGILDSVGNVFKKTTALSFKTYVKLGIYYINTFEEFKTIVEDPLTPSDNITFYISNDNVFIMVGTITCHTENIYVKSQNTSVYLDTLTINTPLIDIPTRIYFDGVCRIGDTEITLSIPSDTTSLHVKEIMCDEMYPSSLNIIKSGAGNLQYNNATNISRSFLTNFDQYQAWDAIRQDEKWAYSHFRTGSGLDTIGKTIAKVIGKSDAYGNFSIKVRYRLCYNETDLILPLFPATLPHGKWVRFERCDYCRDKGRGDGGIYVTPRGFEVAKFYKGDSDLVITNGVLSNEAGAGGLYENQYDDTNTYLSTVVRSTLAQSTFKVKYTDSVSVEDNDTWVIVHLRGVIL